MQRRWAFERVQVIFIKGFFGHRRPCLHRSNRSGSHHGFHIVDATLLNLVHIARHQLDPRVPKSFSALIIERHPAHQFEVRALGGRYDVVTRFPIHPSGHVTQFRGGAPGFVRIQFPRKRRLQDRVVRQRRKNRLTGQSELQLPIHFDHRLSRAFLYVGGLRLVIPLPVHGGSVRHESAANDFSLHDRFVRRYEVNRLSLIQGQQQLFGHGIVPVVLLENPQMPPFLERSQKNRVRFQVPGNVRDFHVILTGLQFHLESLAHHGELLVVNRQRRRHCRCGIILPGVFRSRRHSRERQQQQHQQTHHHDENTSPLPHDRLLTGMPAFVRTWRCIYLARRFALPPRKLALPLPIEY